jgi:hypothetical protein
MKNLEKICMFIAFISSTFSLFICMYKDLPFVWQLNTMIWIVVAYIKLKTIERYEKN